MKPGFFSCLPLKDLDMQQYGTQDVTELQESGNRSFIESLVGYHILVYYSAKLYVLASALSTACQCDSKAILEIS